MPTFFLTRQNTFYHTHVCMNVHAHTRTFSDSGAWSIIQRKFWPLNPNTMKAINLWTQLNHLWMFWNCSRSSDHIHIWHVDKKTTYTTGKNTEAFYHFFLHPSYWNCFCYWKEERERGRSGRSVIIQIFMKEGSYESGCLAQQDLDKKYNQRGIQD